jgi:hypothetical protein
LAELVGLDRACNPREHICTGHADIKRLCGRNGPSTRRDITQQCERIATSVGRVATSKLKRVDLTNSPARVSKSTR